MSSVHLGHVSLGLSLMFGIAACASGGKVPDNERDAGVMDAAPADAPTGGGLGDACLDPRDCLTGLCWQTDPDSPLGMCTQECTGTCPDGYACQIIMVGDFTEVRACIPAQDNFCATCTTNADCGDSGDFCVQLTAGRFCSRDCAGNPGICPTGFTCQTVQGAADTVVGMQCMPVNGICCVDADGDFRGAGDGCITTDCNDANPVVYDDAIEVCDTFDNDCVGGADVDVTDCATPNCQLGQFGYYARAGEPCVNGDCQAQSAVLCDLYTCSEGGEQGDACATSCDGEDNAKCIPPAHCDSSVCLQDLADGQACDEGSDCVSGHCQNGFCCAFGDCCQQATDCPTYGTFDPICENPGTCQGNRGEAVCGPTFICTSTGMQPDDSACDTATVANPCGWYADITCTGGVNQNPPSCPTSCTSNADCDAGGYCDPASNTCVEDLDDGGSCDSDEDRCKSGHCQNGFCCATGDCCNTEIDCPPGYSGPAVCAVPSACQGERDVAQCLGSMCSTSVGVDDDSACHGGILANDCGPYDPIYCDGNSVQNPPMCPTSCSSDADCDANAYCNVAGACVPDQPNGQACSDNDECQSGHCQNGFCCATGDCCANSNDCSDYDIPPDCMDPATCQGARVDGVCNAQFQCTAVMVDDDSGCAGLEADSCGPYPSAICSNNPMQNPPICASMCAGDLNCDVSAHCDAGTCVPDQGQGGFCDEPSDCDNGLFCVDNVCCNSTCTGSCQACDLPGSVGTCTVVPDGQDPDNECGAVDCGAYYSGWVGDTCHTRADVNAAQASCNGAGMCRSAAQECAASGQGPGVLTCDDYCQDPTPGTCTGTTAGACTNLNRGNVTCGAGVCQVTVPACVAGSPNTCVPNSGAASPETCNNIDDNCDGQVDNGSFSDNQEPNGSCNNFKTLPQANSNQTINHNNLTIYGQGDNDFYRIRGVETDSSCSCCDFFCTDEDFRLHLTLTVPPDAGSYMFCTGSSCTGVDANCQEVLSGQTFTWIWTLDGACPGTDSYDRFVRIFGDNAPGYECTPYLFSYRFETGCF